MDWATSTRTIPLWLVRETLREFVLEPEYQRAKWKVCLNIFFPHCLQGIIQKILDIHKVRWTSCFGLRLSNSQFREQVHWLHPDMGVSHVREKYEQARPNEEWR